MKVKDVYLLGLVRFLDRHMHINLFTVWLRMSAGLEPVLSHTEKSYIEPYYRQFSGIILIIYSFTVCGKLSLIRCEN